MAEIIVSPFSVSVDSLPGGTRFIGEHVRFAPLTAEQSSAVTHYMDNLREDLIARHIRARPAFSVPVSQFGFLKSDNGSGRNTVAIQNAFRFCIEWFAGCSVPMISLLIDNGAVTDHWLDEDSHKFRPDNVVSISTESWDRHLAYLEFLLKAIDETPRSRLIIQRIARAARSGPSDDGVIDIAVALESLVGADKEITFQFSLFNSLIYKDDPEQRISTFNLLKMLYQMRSSIVHGGEITSKTRKKLEPVRTSWNDILSLARHNFTYYMKFCVERESGDWDSHLQGLSFGSPRLQV